MTLFLSCITFFFYVLVYNGFAQEKLDTEEWTIRQKRIFTWTQFTIIIIGVLF
jgi:hypothetical protein